MDDSVFDVDGSSDNFSPQVIAKVKPKAASKAPKDPATTKVAPKKIMQTTLKSKPKAAASKKRPKPDSEDEDPAPENNSAHDDTLLSHTPPSSKKQKKIPAVKKAAGKPLQELENEALSTDGAGDKKSKKSTDQYQRLTQLEHILKRPDTYIGSVERSEKEMWVYNTSMDLMEKREVSFVPGLYKIFDEILVNAADNKQRDKNMDAIKITIDREKGQISVWNNGRGIPIEIHEKEKMHIPEMIFGHLLTSSNYDDQEAKVTGGRNGYGAKLANIYSTEFILETADSKTKKKYKQIWTDNMGTVGKASITANKSDDFTKVTFTPDYKLFKMTGMDDDFEALVKRRVFDLAGTSKGVKVSLNGERVKVTNFKKYMEMYTKAIKRERGEEAMNDSSEIIIDNPNARWEIGFAVSDGTFQQVSFVNSIATTSGGTHVNYIADQVCSKLLDIVNKKNKGGAKLKLTQIRNHIFLFVNCLVVNPAFTSQTKEQLTSKVSQFGSTCTVSVDFLKKIAKTEVVQNIMHFAEQKADQLLKKSDGTRRSRMDNPKLTDANKAGTRDGYQCTLILTEGDSAKGLAMAGRSVVGPDLFGVFPLRGKLLNVRDASVDQVSKNAEIQNIKNILGLKHKTDYQDCKSLRYGHIMIMTDQDHDGSHIKGLLINFLQVSFPSLLRIPQFLIEFITPIVKVYKGDPKQPTKSKSFFTMPEYEAWKLEHRQERGWEHKYYKGLGTSTTEDAQVYFDNLDKHLKEFHTMQENEPELIELAFSKKKADERKKWLGDFKPGTYLDHSIKEITYDDFVNKELILFSMADNMRSIPSVIDGLKPGQRKVLYACFKKNLKKDMKVVELAGYVSGLTAYQHGEQSLQQTITGLAQTFVGSNNINCLEPSGNFGSRLQGGSDTASPRYIYTRLSPFARKVFHALDEPLLKYNTDDDRTIEPEMYVPVVPMVLINGADGIGTGWSSTIPNYNPEDIVKNLKLMMDGQEPEAMTPWFRDFKGTVTFMGQDRYKFSGIIKQTSDTEVEITELPIRVWTQDFKDKLVDIIKAEKAPSWIKEYDDYNTHKKVHFVVRLEEKHMKIALEEGLEERFKLSKSVATSNLVAFDRHGRITKYATVEDILKEFYAIRIEFYLKRKAWQMSELRMELEKLSNQARFIQMIIDGKLIVSKKKKMALVSELKQKNFTPFPKVADASKAGEDEPVVENEDEEDEARIGGNAYDYLLGMAIWSLTQERVEKLLKQIGDKQAEIDVLDKLSKEDLWKKDLDDFIGEWRFQLEDEENRQRKVSRLGRRVSQKLKTQIKGGGKKRKAFGDDASDSEFSGGNKAKKAAVAKRVQPKAGLLSHLSQVKPKPSTVTTVLSNGASTTSLLSRENEKPAPKPKSDFWMTIDGALDSDEDVKAAPVLEKAKMAPVSSKPAVVKKKLEAEDDSADEEVTRPKAGAARKPRAAARKPVKYNVVDDDSDSDLGDDMLFDVGKMVKGIGAGSATNGTSSSTAAPVIERPLFSQSSATSRPGSSAGLKPNAAAARKSMAKSSPLDDDDMADDTDYTRLAQSVKGKNRTARETILSDDDDDDEDEFGMSPAPAPVVTKTKPAAATKKPAAPKEKSAPKVKKDAPVVKAVKEVATKPAKPVTLSPAAKAYAARVARKNVIESDSEGEDEVEKMAEEILDDEDGREEEEDEDEESMIKPKSKANPKQVASAVRPARQARAAASKKKAWVLSDDDDEADEGENGNEDEESDDVDEESEAFDDDDSD